MRYIFGQPYSDEEVREILENPDFDKSLVKQIIKLQDATDEFNKEFIREIQPLFKFLDWLSEKFN